jgi:hypothetical protein
LQWEIRGLDLFENEELLVSFKTPPFKFTWRDVPAGKHLLKAKAVDDGGASGMSEPVTVVVRERLPVGFVKRDLPDIYAPGETFKVILEVSSPGDAVQVYAVEERPPKGWTLGNINEGGTFDTASHEVKFGPFLDNKPRTLTYEVTPPANESGPKEFGGVASANGVNSEIEGDHVVAPRSNRHPADIDRADDRIVIRELTAYALAWKTGKEWSIGPNPIPQSYVTRAGEIWRSGETYAYDPAQGPAPLWWVSKPSTALLTSERAKVASAVSERPGRAMRSFGRLGQDARLVYLVTVTVLPDPGVNACTVEEHPPAGWDVSDVSDDGIFDTASGKIRWGIFLDDQARTLSRVAASAVRMTRIIRDLLDFSRVSASGSIPVELRTADVTRIVRRAIAELQAIHPDREILLAPSPPVVARVDPERFAQVVSNLAGNAIQHGALGAPIRVGVEQGSAGVCVTFHNEGPAMAGDPEGLFEPFRRGEHAADAGSAGLGLYIVREVLRAHGGSVEVRSTEADGTTFTIRLPASRTAATGRPAPER